MSTITVNAQFISQQAQAAVGKFSQFLVERLGAIKKFNQEIQNGQAALNQILTSGAALVGANALRSYAAEALKARQANAELEQSLQTTNRASEGYRKSLAATRDSLKELIGADDDATVSVQAMLNSWKVSQDQMERSTLVVYDLAAALKTDAVDAARQLGSALAGEDVGGAKLRLEIDKTLPKIQQVESALSQIEGRYKGQARAQFLAGSPDLRRFQIALDDTKKSLGNLFLDLSGPFFSTFTAGVINARQNIERFKNEFPGISEFARNAAQATGSLVGEHLGKIALLVTGLLAIKAASMLLILPINLLRGSFVALTGVAMLPALAALHAWTLALPVVTGLAGQLGTTLASLRIIFSSLAGWLGILGAAFAGFTLGQFLNEFEISGVKIKHWAQLTWLEIFHSWEKTKNYLAGFGGYVFDSMSVWFQKIIIKAKEAALAIATFFHLPGRGGLEGGLRGDRATLATLEGTRDSNLQKKIADSTAEYQAEVAALEKTKAELLGKFQSRPGGKVASPDFPEVPGYGGHNSADGSKFIEEINQSYIQTILKRGVALDQEYSHNLLRLRQEVKDVQDFNIAKLQLDAVYRAQKRALADQEATAQSEIRMAQIQALREDAEKSSRLTDVEKKRLLIPLLREENRLVLENIEINRLRVQDPSLSDEAKLNAQRQLLELERAKLDIRLRLQELDSQGFMGTMQQQLISMSNEWQNFGRNVAGVLTGGIRSAVDGVGDAIMGVIEGTRTWGQVFANIGKQIVASLIKIVVQYVANHAMMMALSAIAHTKEKSQAATTGATSAAAYAPAAALASTSSFGTAAIVGMIALAAILALAAGASAMATGGPIRGPGGPTDDRVLIRASAGEFMVKERAASFYGPQFMNALNNMQLPVSGYATGGSIGAGGGSDSFSPAFNVPAAKVSVVVVNNEQELRRFMESHAGEQIVMRHMGNRKSDLGIGS